MRRPLVIEVTVMEKLRVYGICGSLRKGSFNYKLLQAAGTAAAAAGLEVHLAEQEDLNLPLYNLDIEQRGFTPAIMKVIEGMQNSDLVFLASPEYNYSLSPVLKNALDWCSRFRPYPMGGKVAVIMGASNGHFGTIRMQFHLRQVLTSLNMQVVPQPQVFLTDASDDSFNPDGTVKDQKLRDQLQLLINRSAELAMKLKNQEGK
jgi:chromate reductase, NAD(P)H dehydrogenase (quinone)